MKGSDWIDFDKAMNDATEMLKDPKLKHWGLYIIVSINTGLRVSDIRKIRLGNLHKERLELTEQKTGKKINRKINNNIKEALTHFDLTREARKHVVKSINREPITTQAINRFLKKRYGISSHGLRKSFGRHVYNINGQCEDALIKLSEIYNHISLKDTRIYLGIRQKEIDDIFANM